MGSIPELGTSPGGGNGNLTTIVIWKILWTEKLVGYSPWGHKKLFMTEHFCRSRAEGEKVGKVNHDK